MVAHKLIQLIFPRAYEIFPKPADVSKAKWGFVVLKKFFDTGYGITNYVKYVIAIFGLSSLDVGATMAFSAIYGVSCLFIGYLWFDRRFAELDIETGNMVNRFVVEMREKIGNVHSNKK